MKEFLSSKNQIEMALFGKKQNDVQEVELFTEEPNERVFEFKKSKTVVRVDDYFIRIARKSNVSNVLLHGLDGEKSILLSEITAYQLKEPGATVGYLQLVYPGSSDVKGGVFDAVKDENTVTFLKEDKESILELKKAIEEALKNKVRK
nr:MAG TPA: protein of unknown function (DUF4429) [Caudoviricetes sp.]